ncbi:MAG: DUF2059 domain-containing protein [Opitutus sp.]
MAGFAVRRGRVSRGVQRDNARIRDRVGAARWHKDPRTMTSKIVFAALLSATSAWAIDDSPEHRKQQAARYMEATPPQALFADMAEQMAKNLPPEQRNAFKTTLTKHLDIAAISQAITEAMVKCFTADELHALADFYGSAVGKSAMKKFGTYMADVMPAIQSEMMKATAKTNRELPTPSQK